jgi:hypothetical protein
MRCLTFGSLLILTGCISPGVSDPVSVWEIAGPTRSSSVSTKIFLPTDLRRPTLVTHDQGRVTIHDFDRWGTPLPEALAGNLAAAVADLPIQSLVVQVQRLEVSQAGNTTLLFNAGFTLNGSPQRIESEVIQVSKGELSTESSRPLSAAFGAYTFVPVIMAERIRAHVAKEQGVIAKPSTTVTVPTK